MLFLNNLLSENGKQDTKNEDGCNCVSQNNQLIVHRGSI